MKLIFDGENTCRITNIFRPFGEGSWRDCLWIGRYWRRLNKLEIKSGVTADELRQIADYLDTL